MVESLSKGLLLTKESQIALVVSIAVVFVTIMLARQARRGKSASSSSAKPSNATTSSRTGGGEMFVYVQNLAQDPPLKSKSVCVLLIDPQTDFCDPTKGSLYVPGAEKDIERFASSFKKLGLAKTAAVFVTLDTHQQYHIAHSLFWVSSENSSPPKPFTLISQEDVASGKWRARRPEHQKWAEEYVSRLESGGRFKLVVWPDHCLVGTEGHAVYPPLGEALREWERAHGSAVNYVLKGNNAFTEHYSAIKAEVEVADDVRTHLNTGLVAQLKQFDRIVVAGQAKSHCVNFTVRDLVAQLPEKARGKVWVCADGCSSVTGFEAEGETFAADMKKMGVRFVKCTEAFM